MTAEAAKGGADVHTEGIGALALGALGVVYGDIGTSPLYTIKTAVAWTGRALTPEEALGMLSLILWTLVIITSVKYVAVIMRADNDGEGGILALMSLLGVKHGRRPCIIAMGMLGAALLFGDGAITPAISVLSALEGLKGAAPPIAPYVVPLSILVLIALFCLQPQGTGRISKLFGPIMATWFVVIAVLGLSSVMRHPQVLAALNPIVGLHYRHWSRSCRFPGARRGFSLRHRRRSALCGHGPFRRPADTLGVVRPGLPGPDPLLRRPDGAAPRRAVRQGFRSVLRALPSRLATSAYRAGDGGDGHREPIDHHRRLFDDAPGDPARPSAACAHFADLGAELWADLRRNGQLVPDGFDPRAHGDLPVRRTIWRRPSAWPYLSRCS